MALHWPTLVLGMELFVIGSWLLIGCCATYLAWWSIAFNPMRRFPMGPKVALFLVTLALGLGGVVVTIVGMVQCPVVQAAAPNWLIACAGLALYVALLLLTSRVMKRSVTTELILIVGWLTLEACALNSLLAAVYVTDAAFWTCLAIDIVAVAIGMACYLRYYDLPKRAAFLVGMVPLVLFAVAMGASIAIVCVA